MQALLDKEMWAAKKGCLDIMSSYEAIDTKTSFAPHFTASSIS